MESFRVPHTELPHASRLFSDFLYHPERVAPFYADSPFSPDSYAAAAARIHFPDHRRAAIVSALREQNGDHPSLAALARPETVAIVTGQQVGLFGGPCYAIYKALTAVKLARELTARGIEAVPVFWMATEDHDFPEVSHCWSFDARQRPVFLQVENPGRGQGPVGEVRLHNPPLNELRASLSALPYGDEVAAIAEVSYSAGRTMGDAYQDLVRQLLPPDILFLDPLKPSIRALAAPLLGEALRVVVDLNRILRERTLELEDAGYHSQVHIEHATSLLFHLNDGKRIPLRLHNGGLTAGDRPVDLAQLVAEPETLSPNALLRPVMQDFLLPTAAYVGGPAEVAYFAQSQVLYKALLDRMPVVVPRATFTILDSRAAKLMGRYELKLDAFFHGLDALEERIAATLIPADLQESLLDATESVTGHISELHADLTRFDPTLAAALEKSRAKIFHQLAKIERKAAREALRREDRAEADAAYLQNLILPHKHPQERLYTFLPFVARYGFDFVNSMYEEIRLDVRDHVVVTA